ncbi:MAG: Asp-tRNA(Asn)/Glu-tRNA(Gln) amidotransferase subunit GatB [Candidatus Gracilibacteria bacterium]|nr:Asp-tRNA(Asn)/Glu-tRNA(Gln) amidotransferase subunit GatB [Candidatus Gracilibacteria bacterium]MDD2908929.1 Asp-tRNA(Asn)/Glu-tRNA(Gln) amidotransferase subunit GatB [Candidatus Gracilibacteria bacterium]
MYEKYEIVMGLETHIRIKSQTKMFCSCKNSLELAGEPNESTCPVCMGFPGMLPVLNEEVVNLAVRAGHAMKCIINEKSEFDRKSYFYPDSPSGYQITQLYHPIVEHGEVRTFVNGELVTFRINRMHIENDAGKLVHAGTKTLCDYNRAGGPLMEIVTEPDFRSKEEVIAYLEELQKIIRFSGASNADMDKGQLRCDVNISLRLHGENVLNNRVEIKNMNSFAAIGRAIDTEFKRQVKLYEKGEKVEQETRGWNDEKGISNSLRSKEDAMDYRYFPEPDLPPLVLTKEYIEARKINELPLDRRLKYLNEYKIGEDEARILSNERDISDYFENLVKLTNDPKKSCSYVTSILIKSILDYNNSSATGDNLNFGNIPFDISEMSEIIILTNKDELSSTNAKIVVEELFKRGNSGKTSEIVDEFGLRQTNDTGALEQVVKNVIENNPTQLAEYKAGKVNLFGYFVGQAMKESKGQGNPKIFTELLKKYLD